jgi:hypothetical protein
LLQRVQAIRSPSVLVISNCLQVKGCMAALTISNPWSLLCLTSGACTLRVASSYHESAGRGGYFNNAQRRHGEVSLAVWIAVSTRVLWLFPDQIHGTILAPFLNLQIPRVD